MFGKSNNTELQRMFKHMVYLLNGFQIDADVIIGKSILKYGIAACNLHGVHCIFSIQPQFCSLMHMLNSMHITANTSLI